MDTYPTYSFCLYPPDDYKRSEVELPFHDYVLGKTFNISYYTEGFWFEITSEGNKYNNVSGETLNVKLITQLFTCYKINSTSSDFRGTGRGLKINFEPWFPKEKLPKLVKFFLSSEHNVYTITFGKRMNGKMLEFETKLGTWSGLTIKAEKFIYLKETSKCTDQSFWEMWEPAYANKVFEKCPKRCAAITLPNNRYINSTTISGTKIGMHRSRN